MSRKKLPPVTEIIERVKFVHGIKKDYDLAKMLDLKQNTISNWRKRESIDLVKIFSICDGVDKDWILYGEGEPYPDPDIETVKIVQMLKGMTKEQKRDVLKYIEKEKLWKELMEEREDKKKGA